MVKILRGGKIFGRFQTFRRLGGTSATTFGRFQTFRRLRTRTFRRLCTAIFLFFCFNFKTTFAQIPHFRHFHVSGELKVPANVTIIQLPAYSPELNPIENLWHYLKSHYWSNRAYADYDQLEIAAIQAWQIAVLNPDLMKTVCAAPYANGAISD